MCSHLQNSYGDPVYPLHTKRNNLCYFFYSKHHGLNNNFAAQWDESVSQDDEFSMFDDADAIFLGSPRCNLYCVLKKGNDILRIGTWGQIVAKFPVANSNSAWHGFPLSPILNSNASGLCDIVPKNALDILEKN